ncbi:FAD-binding domain-containing protein [Dothidotthia symphoricarpi CBS 119687]|uniref:FAD-binding domain-containing protein n=1 Tax=Dothidotthia symphoricarpi CBS 119687 TaxID=1392245 RepID=A0A6A6A783_9PLEO|nr:FAD-binding domain-containing protein [Dothidotthia symphoricarpi CBS 119687]KAF2127003.1 FAD-binding domain-containing protein [Dothidotthia symphoricarpi CBS 119687]
MRSFLTITLGFISAGVLAQEAFEQPDFNVTRALLNNGVDISVIPELAGSVERSSVSSCACKSLKLLFADDQVETQGEPAYAAVIDYFWSTQQKDPAPYCIFKPEKATQVSTLVLLARLTQCPFAIRSGGHAAFVGASSIDGGITVTFERMKGITLSDSDKKVASIEPGNLWYDVYTTLAVDNLAVVGGRVSTIGVGGLTLGGGISFFANTYGWACDNVASFEVVTASGIIVTASPTSFPDLYWALRGGGNNFGIVTRFDLETFSHGSEMFGGQRQFFEDSFPAAIDAFHNLGVNSADDPKATQFLAVTLYQGVKLAVAELEHADPIVDAPIFAEYRAVPAFADTTGIKTLANLTEQLNNNNPKGYRETYWTASSKLDKQMVEFVVNTTFEEFAKIADVTGLVPSNTLQIITVPQLEQMARKGGNALGLSPPDGPIFLINPACRWDKVEDDARVLAANANIVKRMVAEAERRDLTHEYLYMNYASQFQHVIGSYGDVNGRELKAVSAKYDPTGVFQKLQPGYFKLAGPPVADWPKPIR